MFSDKTIRIIVAGALFFHAVAHAIAIGALLSQMLNGVSTSRVEVRSWLFPSLTPNRAALMAAPFWIVSTIGFLVASASFWGIFLEGEAWRQIAVISAIISILGIALFSGVWPGSPNPMRSLLNTSIALIMNAAVLITQLLLHWPAEGA